MAFKSNNKLSTGRPKGAVNKTTAETKELLQKIVSKELEGIAERLEKLDNKERIDAVIKLLPYIVPRQTEIAVDNKLNQFTPINVNLIEDGSANKQ
ncbi:hypothetical protein AB3G34_02315 [Flavobacterium sp. WC2409]|uniref:Uncharacterized protein n=1 Tax=Flavobacterium sp. WC2409 TaxID=3234139 RepID=A0AB39W635_9FLAO